MDKLEFLQVVEGRVNDLVTEREELRKNFADTNPMTNSYWMHRKPEEATSRLKCIEVDLAGLLHTQAEKMQEIQRETLKKVMQ
jgi:hypothetical protein